MSSRRYYSSRTGKNADAARLALPILLRLFSDIYVRFVKKDYFQEAFGYFCVDEGEVAGTLGDDIEAQILFKVRKENLWPISDCVSLYTEDDLFDMIEFLHDHVSKPTDGFYHDFNSCGWHYSTFDRESGKQEFREEINAILRDYKEGFELTTAGEIFSLTEPGMEPLMGAEIPDSSHAKIRTRIEAAKLKFRRHRSSLEERRDAVRDLADVLELLRPQIKEVLLSKDEAELFVLANKFGIRHYDQHQKTEYDPAIWYSWMFYYYLATIHACVRMVEKQEKSKPSEE